ncbi:ABC transporter substrate-binding protein [Corynebacterium sp. 335C]
MRLGGSGRKVAAVLLAGALALTGCSRGEGGEAGGGETAGGAADERIAAVGLGDGDTLLALGKEPVLVATWGSPGDVGPSHVGPWAEPLLGDNPPEGVDNAGRGFSAEVLETIAAADPTQIIAVNNAVDEQAEKALNDIAPTTVKPEGTVDWQIPWPDQVRAIAAAVGEEEKGEELITETEADFENFRKEHGDLQGDTAAIVMPYEGKIGIYTSGDGRGQFIESLGFTIPESIEGPDPETFYRDIALEEYDVLNDVEHLFVLDYKGAVDALKQDDTFMNLDVVKDGRVKFLSEDVGNAMSMPNPVTIPWVIDQIKQEL